MKKKWKIVRENEVKKTMRGRVRSNQRNEKEMKDREREWSKKKKNERKSKKQPKKWKRNERSWERMK